MNTSSEATLLKLIENSLSYPSGDNCQAFRFKIKTSDDFEILHESKVAKHRLNFDSLASVLALGNLLELLKIQAKALGYELKILKLLKDVDDEYWAHLKIVKSPEPTDGEAKLASASNERVTDRRKFSKEPIEEKLKQEILSVAREYKKMRFVLSDDISANLSENILNLEEIAWTDIQAGQDLIKWIRFDKESAMLSRDGMPWLNLEAPFILKPILKLWNGRRRIQKFFIKLGSAKSASQTLEKQLTNAGAFGWFFVNDFEIESMVEVGKCYFRIWVILNQNGFGFQPITTSTFGTYSYKKGVLPIDWPSKAKNYYEKMEKIMQNDFSLPRDFFPIWGFRAGRVSALEVEKRTFRKSLKDSLV